MTVFEVIPFAMDPTIKVVDMYWLITPLKWVLRREISKEKRIEITSDLHQTN
eukprot:gene39134-48335_t